MLSFALNVAVHVAVSVAPSVALVALSVALVALSVAFTDALRFASGCALSAASSAVASCAFGCALSAAFTAAVSCASGCALSFALSGSKHQSPLRSLRPISDGCTIRKTQHSIFNIGHVRPPCGRFKLMGVGINSLLIYMIRSARI